MTPPTHPARRSVLCLWLLVIACDPADFTRTQSHPLDRDGGQETDVDEIRSGGRGGRTSAPEAGSAAAGQGGQGGQAGQPPEPSGGRGGSGGGGSGGTVSPPPEAGKASLAGSGGTPAATPASEAWPFEGLFAKYRGLSGKVAQEISSTFNVQNDNIYGQYSAGTYVELVGSDGVARTYADPQRGTARAAAFIGVQPGVHGLGPHGAVFMVFGPSSGKLMNGTPCKTAAESGMGTTCQIRDAYEHAKRYTLRVAHMGDGVFRAFIDDRAFATITVPDVAGIGSHVDQRVGPFERKLSCRELPYLNIALGNPVFTPSVELEHTVQFSAQRCKNAYSFENRDERWITFELGTPSEHIPIALKSKLNGRWLRTRANTQGCEGGQLIADGAPYDGCANLARVVRLPAGFALQSENGARLRCNEANRSVLADDNSLGAVWTETRESDGFYSYRWGERYLSVSDASVTCDGTSAGDNEKFFRVDVPQVQQYSIRNAWNDAYLVDRGSGSVDYASVSPSESTARWFTEPATGSPRSIRNVQTQAYLTNTEVDDEHALSTSSMLDGSSGSDWAFEPVNAEAVRLQSVSAPGQFIHVQNLLGFAEVGEVQPGWVSAHWLLEWIAPRENKALTAAVSGSSERPDQGYALARDGAGETEWSSNGETSGAYLEYSWPSAQSIQSLVVRGRLSAVDHVTSATITFSDGSAVMLNDVKPDASPLPLEFAPKTVTWLRFTVSAVSPETMNAGLAELEVY